MLKKYSDYINKYSDAFMKHGYETAVGLYWEGRNQKRYYNRLPITDIYKCYVYCEVQQGGEPVKIQSNDGEADFYWLSGAWQVSEVKKRFGKLVVTLYFDKKDVAEDMEDLIHLLDNC